MKRIIIIGVLILSSIATLSAQPQGGQGGRNANFHEFQMQMIVKQLAIDESKQADFKKIYTEYSKSMQGLRPDKRHNTSSMTDEQIEAQILKSFSQSEQITALKKEYYYKFKTVLTPDQILKMYNIERQVNERINSEMQNRRKGPGGGRERAE